MNRQLMLMRHGKSDWSVDVDDYKRPLKTRGKRGAERIAAWLQQHQLQPDYIITSPAERAYNSAEKLTKAMGLSTQHIHRDKRIYAADLNTLKTVLADCPAQAQRVLLIGHNPDLEELLLHLHQGSLKLPDDGKLLATATLAILNMPDNWSRLKRSCAEVISITRASTLPKLFPYNGLTGLEQRQRPAYYYSQSAAIPYRMVKNECQILLISSSGKNHWGIPKGIIEPGCSASASAAIEAREEAGVKGVISEQMLGCYQYEKWGASCSVQVFPLAVTDMIPDKDWEENHRHRQWLTLKKAATLIDQAPMQAILASFATHITQQ